MKICKLRIGVVTILTALLFGCGSINVRQAESKRGDKQILFLVDSVKHGELEANNNLRGASDVATAVIGGQTYLFVAAFRDNAVNVFRVADDGSLTYIDDIEDGERGANNLNGPRDVATATIGGQTYLFVAAHESSEESVRGRQGQIDDQFVAAYESSAVSVFNVADDGRLSFVDDVQDLERGVGNLLGANSVATAVIGRRTYLFVGANYESDDINNKAVSVFRVANNGRLSFVDDVSDGDRGSYNLEVATADIESQTYLFVSVARDSTVSVFSVANDGSLFFVDDAKDGEPGSDRLRGAWNPTTAIIGSQTYLFVAAIWDDAVSVFRVTDDGRLTFVDDLRYGDRGANNLDGADDLATAVIDDQTYLFVTARPDGAVTVFSIADDGILSFVDDIRDEEREADNLEEASDVATAVINGHTYLFVAAIGDNAVNVFRVNPSDSNN